MESKSRNTKVGTPNRATWKQNPDGVRANILEIALAEFAQNGLSGARIDEIALKTNTSKRMIYYYFGDKERLYCRALEEAYRKVRKEENALDLDHMEPTEAMRQLVQFTFDHHRRNPEFIRLVMIENIHHGAYLRHSEAIKSLNEAAISKIEDIYQRGLKKGVFKAGLTPLSIHWQISALSFFNVSNASSFGLLFGNSLFTPNGQDKLRDQVAEMILAFVSMNTSR